MIAGWKLKREARRFMTLFYGLKWRFTAGYQKKLYDKRKSQTMVVHDGQPSLGKNYAVFLIFQPNGVSASTLEQIENFKKNGVATVIVSNAPLTAKDRDCLTEVSFKVIERENYGYDFGGYRDGILYLLDLNIEIEALFVMNDSIWLIDGGGQSLLEAARQAPEDLYGIYYNHRPKTPKRSHLQSYFYRFNSEMVASQIFREYWEDLPLYNNKHLVIRKLEMGLTHFFKSNGFSLGYLQDAASIFEAFRALDPHHIVSVVDYCIQVNTKSAVDLKRLRTLDFNKPENKELFLATVKKWGIHKYLFNIHPHVLIGLLKSPALKKDKQFMYRLQRREILKYGYSTSFSDAARLEIEKSV